MKISTYLYSIFAAGLILAAGCAKDNFKAPESKLTGRVVYQDQNVGVRSTGVVFEIWQHGYQLFTKIPLNIAQDGTFSALLFDGDYKLVRTKGAGPWVDVSDSIDVKVQGATTVNIPVDPYFMVKNVSFVKNGATVEVTFTVQAVNTTKTLELVRLYIGPNLILDQNNNSANIQALAAAVNTAAPVKLRVSIPAAIATQDYIFARVGVKTTGIAELMYSAPQKVQLK
jgi:hypothetical protein